MSRSRRKSVTTLIGTLLAPCQPRCVYTLARESANVLRCLAGLRCIPIWIFEIGRLGRASLERLEKVSLHAPHLYHAVRLGFLLITG
jgi:hypothetical protein